MVADVVRHLSAVGLAAVSTDFGILRIPLPKNLIWTKH
jgi:hypothetical protein